jgi:hypothetical protein
VTVSELASRPVKHGGKIVLFIVLILLAWVVAMNGQERAPVERRSEASTHLPTITMGSGTIPPCVPSPDGETFSCGLTITDPSFESTTNLQLTYDAIAYEQTRCSVYLPGLVLCPIVYPLAVVELDGRTHSAVINGKVGSTFHWLAVTP